MKSRSKVGLNTRIEQISLWHKKKCKQHKSLAEAMVYMTHCIVHEKFKCHPHLYMYEEYNRRYN